MTSREKLLRIMEKVLLINEWSNHDVFLSLYPHVQEVSVSIYVGGYRETMEGYDECYNYYYDGTLSKDGDYNQLMGRLDELVKEVLEDD